MKSFYRGRKPINGIRSEKKIFIQKSWNFVNFLIFLTVYLDLFVNLNSHTDM